MSDEFETFSLPNLQLIRSVLPSSIYKSIMSEIDEMKEGGSFNEYNSKLAGAIEEEYELIKSRSYLIPFLKNMASQYRGVLDVSAEWDVGNMWVNLQKKNEYNPLHNHNGYLSFVIWMQIPFKYSDECKVKNVVNSNQSKAASTFEISYQNILGQTTFFRFPVGKGWEGRIVMFPSQLMHQVYPFYTSDGYRISISGNLIIKNIEE